MIFSLSEQFYGEKCHNLLEVVTVIGKMLKILRSNKGYNQTELAQLLNIAQTTLSGYETSYSNPRFDVIESIANLCDYEIIFRKKGTKEEMTTASIRRADV